MKLSMFAHFDPITDLNIARVCDRPGIDGLWFDETLWQVGAFPIASACASITERLRVGIGIVTATVADPTYLAMHYGTLAEISGGRAILGLGSGVEGSLRKIGIDTRLPRTAVKEAIEIIRAMLDGETVTYKGKRFTANDVHMGFKPTVDTPLFWGAMGNRSIETCGAVADGWLISIMEPAPYVERGVELLHKGAREAGRDPSGIEVVQFHPFACDDDSEAARNEAKEIIAEIASTEFNYFVGMEEYVDAFVPDLDGVSKAQYLDVMSRLADGESPVRVVPDALVEQVAIAGTPDECAAKIRQFEKLGVTEVVLKPSNSDAERFARVVGDEIAPRLA